MTANSTKEMTRMHNNKICIIKPMRVIWIWVQLHQTQNHIIIPRSNLKWGLLQIYQIIPILVNSSLTKWINSKTSIARTETSKELKGEIYNTILLIVHHKSRPSSRLTNTILISNKHINNQMLNPINPFWCSNRIKITGAVSWDKIMNKVTNEEH